MASPPGGPSPSRLVIPPQLERDADEVCAWAYGLPGPQLPKTVIALSAVARAESVPVDVRIKALLALKALPPHESSPVGAALWPETLLAEAHLAAEEVIATSNDAELTAACSAVMKRVSDLVAKRARIHWASQMGKTRRLQIRKASGKAGGLARTPKLLARRARA